MSHENSIIELVGLGTMMSWTFIDEDQWNLLQSESPEQDQLLQQLVNRSQNDNVFSGCQFTEAQLLINGELVCESFSDMIDRFSVTSHPVERLIEFADKPYCFVQDELNRGVWGCSEVDGEIDHSMLHFHVHQTDLPGGLDTISAEYDGEELDFGGTETKSVYWYVLDREGNKVTPVETLISLFGLGEQLVFHDPDNSTKA